jgi:hypothetical protein
LLVPSFCCRRFDGDEVKCKRSTLRMRKAAKVDFLKLGSNPLPRLLIQPQGWARAKSPNPDNHPAFAYNKQLPLRLSTPRSRELAPCRRPTMRSAVMRMSVSRCSGVEPQRSEVMLLPTVHKNRDSILFEDDGAGDRGGSTSSCAFRGGALECMSGGVGGQVSRGCYPEHRE